MKMNFVGWLACAVLALGAGCSRESAPELMALAEVSATQGDYETASKLFAQAAEIEPKNGFIRWRKARMLLSIQDGAGAEQEIRAAAQQGVGDDRTRAALAHALFLQNDWQALAELSNKDLGKTSRSTVLAFQVVALARLGRLDEAEPLLAEATQISPYSTNVVFAGAVLAAKRQMFGSAIEGLQKIIEIEPDYPYVASEFGNISMQRGDVRAAEEFLSQAIRRLHRADSERLKRAAARIQMHNYDLAAEDALTVLDTDPQNVDALVLAFRAIALEGDYDRAKQTLHDSLGAFGGNAARTPADAGPQILEGGNKDIMSTADRVIGDLSDQNELATLRAQILLRAGREPDAREVLAGILARDPANVAAVRTLTALDASDQTGAVETAYIDTALEQRPDDVKLRLLRANMASAAEDWPAYVRHLQHAISAAPNELMARSLLARHFLHKEQSPQKALQLLERVDTGANADMLETRAASYLQLSRIDEALAAYQRLRKSAPRHIDAGLVLARLYGLKGDRPAQVEIYRQLIETMPDKALAEIARVHLLIDASKFSKAEELLTSVNLPDENPELLHAWLKLTLASGQYGSALGFAERLWKTKPDIFALLALSRAHGLQGKYDQAISALESWRESNPQQLTVLRELANLYAVTGRADEKISTLSLIVQLDPNDSAASNNLAWALRDRDPERALRYANRAHELNSESTEIRDTLAVVLAKNGQYDSAIAQVNDMIDATETPTRQLLRRAEIYLMAGKTEEAHTDLTAVDPAKVSFEELERQQHLLYALQTL